MREQSVNNHLARASTSLGKRQAKSIKQQERYAEKKKNIEENGPETEQQKKARRMHLYFMGLRPNCAQPAPTEQDRPRIPMSERIDGMKAFIPLGSDQQDLVRRMSQTEDLLLQEHRYMSKKYCRMMDRAFRSICGLGADVVIHKNVLWGVLPAKDTVSADRAHQVVQPNPLAAGLTEEHQQRARQSFSAAAATTREVAMVFKYLQWVGYLAQGQADTDLITCTLAS